MSDDLDSGLLKILRDNPPDALDNVPKKAPELDPYILFKQIDLLRQEGVSEDVIREAFNQFMAERQGIFKTVQPTMKRTPESLPMPSQQDINEMYEARYKDIVDNGAISPHMQDILDACLNARKIQVLVEEQAKIGFFKGLALKTRYLLLKGVLATTIWVFKRLGVK